MALISGGAAPAFDGGTISTALDVESPTSPAVTAHVTAGSNVTGLLAKGNGVRVRALADSGAEARLQADASQAMLLLDNSNTTDDFLECTTATADLFTVSHDGQTALRPSGLQYPFSVKNAAGSEVLRVLAAGALGLKAHAVPADGTLGTGECGLWFDQTNGAAKLAARAKQADGTAVTPGVSMRDLSTAPAGSSTPTLALGTAYQNTLGYDVLLLICLNVTVNTSGVLKLGVDPTATPTQSNIISGVTTTGQWNIPIMLPNQYYALLSTTGTITVAIDGQIAMPV